MKIAIIGYGKMGKTIEGIALERGHEITHRFDIENPFEKCDEINSDIAIEFTTPKMAATNILHASKLGLPIVVGTTGWYDDFEEICDQLNKSNSSMFYATNFSVGVNIFFKLNKVLADLMNSHKSYLATMEEIHHTEKKDAPSGTAITLAEGIIENHENYNQWLLKDESKTSTHSLPIEAKRIENVPGTHTITYGNDIDEISITHTAHNRMGFATGAVIAAEWLLGKTGVYTMSDLLNLD